MFNFAFICFRWVRLEWIWISKLSSGLQNVEFLYTMLVSEQVFLSIDVWKALITESIDCSLTYSFKAEAYVFVT